MGQSILSESEFDAILQYSPIPIHHRAKLYAHDAVLRHTVKGTSSPLPSPSRHERADRVIEKIVRVEVPVYSDVSTDRAAIVAWLREISAGATTVRGLHTQKLADRIEAGEYLKKDEETQQASK